MVTTVDPLLASGKSDNPQTFNRYVYGMNSPMIYTDTDGLQVGDYQGNVFTDGHKWRKKPFLLEDGKTLSPQFKGATNVSGNDGYLSCHN